MNAPNAAGLDHDRKVADFLMLKEAPILAGIVTIVAQPFAQISETYHLTLPDWLPLVVAAVVSSLLALYYVRTARRIGLPDPAADPDPLLRIDRRQQPRRRLALRHRAGNGQGIRGARNRLAPATEECQTAAPERGRARAVVAQGAGHVGAEKVSQAAIHKTGFARRAEAVLGLFVGDAIGGGDAASRGARGNGATNRAVGQNDELDKR